MNPAAREVRELLIREQAITACNADGEADQSERGELRVNSYLRRTTPEERETPTQLARRERRER
jgi:hypothetical protein